MDTDPKSRRPKHVKNKKKYNKHKPSGHAQIPQKSKSLVLESNWSRYESDDENEDNRIENVTKLDSRTDFSILANLPISQGSHFQFKTQSLIDEDEPPIKAHDLFKLDLNLLDYSIATIPFHKRCNIDNSYFTKDEQEALIRAAVKSEIIYKDYLNKNNMKITNQSIFDHLERSENESELSTQDEGHEFISQVLDSDSANSNGNLIDNTNNNNYNDKVELVTLQNNQIKNDTNDENLEKWLDDILDD